MQETSKKRFRNSISTSINRFVSPETAIILLCLASIIGVYWHDSNVLLDDALRNEMASYILALPFLIVYMIYRKRNLLRAQLHLETEKTENIILKDVVAASVCISALLLYVYGSFTFNFLQYHLISLMIFVAGCSTFLLGVRNLRKTIFPLALLLLLIVPYREEAYQASAQLSILTSTLTFNLLKVLGYPVSLTSLYESPSITIRTASGSEIPFVIDIPCAGAYSLIGFLVFALFFAYISRGSLLKKTIWLILGFGLIYAANIARLSLILMVGYWLGAEKATGLFHLLSGSVLIFFASLLMIVVGGKILKIGIFSAQDIRADHCPSCEKNKTRNEPFCGYCGRFFNSSNITISKADIGKIIALSLLIAALTNLQVPSFVLAQANVMELDTREPSDANETRGFLPTIDGYEPRFVYRDQRFERVSQQDAALLYVYHQQNSSIAPILASIEIADSYSKLHRWEICLYIVPEEQGRQLVTPIQSKDVQILENPPLSGRLFVFKYVRSNQTVMILYWYEKATLKIGGSWANRYVKTSLIAYLDNFVRTEEIKSVNEYGQLESRLISMAQTVINHWEPVKEWSAYIVIFAQYGQTLAIATAAAGSSLYVMLHLKRDRDERNRANTMYKQLVWHSTFSKREKEILEVLKTLTEKETATLTELAESHKEKTGRKMNPKELANIVKHMEDHGLVKRILANRDQEPILLWKPTATRST